MTPKERMITALNRGVPDRVPTFELEFQLSGELVGREMLTEEDLKGLSEEETEAKLRENAALLAEVYTLLEHDAICIQYLNHRGISPRRIGAIANLPWSASGRKETVEIRLFFCVPYVSELNRTVCSYGHPRIPHRIGRGDTVDLYAVGRWRVSGNREEDVERLAHPP